LKINEDLEVEIKGIREECEKKDVKDKENQLKFSLLEKELGD